MAFPEIYACLIAEDARVELYRKLTILGLYGVAPRVEIAIKDMSKPIGPLAFILFAGGTEGGKYRIKPYVISNDEEELIKAPPAEIEIPKTGGHNLLIRTPPIVFPKEGTYKFALDVDGKRCYEVIFRVRPGKPDEF